MWLSALPSLIQVALPEDVQGRRRHSATVFGSGPNFRQVVMVGGQTKSGGNAETTLLNLGEVITTLLCQPTCFLTAQVCPSCLPHLELQDGKQVRSITALKGNELGRPEERLRMKMKRSGLTAVERRDNTLGKRDKVASKV